MAAFMYGGRAGKFCQNLARLQRGKILVLRSCGTPGHIALCLSAPSSCHLSTQSGKKPGQPVVDKPSSVSGSKTSDVAIGGDISLDYRERFVPLTRRSLVRHLMQEKSFLTNEEQQKFEELAVALDSAIINRYHSILRELKTLFDPINPDKETVSTRKVNKREKLDNEFWLLQKLVGVMEQANFHELPRAYVEQALQEHDARHGVKVSVNTDKYDVMRFWALGRETPSVPLSSTQRLVNAVMRRPAPKPSEYFKRVVVAVRLKKDDKLLLKAFKEVPANALEQLLPDGKIRMSKLDKGVIAASGAIALTGILAKVVTWLAQMHVDWTLILTGVTGLVGIQTWTTYKNRHLSYVNDHSRMLYYKNIANNRGLLTLLIDRAEDELLKETLLTYSFLLTSRPPSALEKDSIEHQPAELGSISAAILEKKIEEWVEQKTKQRVVFNSAEAARILADLGILSKDLNENLHVLSLDATLRNLPQTPQSITSRVDESDIIEGYDRDISEETDEEYKSEEKKRKFFGWF